MPLSNSLKLATRGSPLALAQAKMVAAAACAVFPELSVELKIIRTTGDKLQKASMAKPEAGLPKGLFTKELEVALLQGEADLAVHSLKDLPTDLPEGLVLGAVLERADPRDVLIYRSIELAEAPPSPVGGSTPSGGEGPSIDRPVVEGSAQPRPTQEGASGGSPQPCPTGGGLRRGFAPNLRLADLPDGAVVATSSTRRREQLLALRPDLHVIEIRGNVGTRLQKLADRSDFDATMLAAAGLARLGFEIGSGGSLIAPATAGGAGPVAGAGGASVPEGLLAVRLPVEEMIPCVGQAAIGIEVRVADPRMAEICARLNHMETFQCVTAERAFLHALGGGCQSPVAAFAVVGGGRLTLRGVSFRSAPARRGEVNGSPDSAARLGQELAKALR